MKSKLLGQYIQKKRDNANLSQKEIADKMGYSTAQYISNVERHICLIPIEDISKFAEILGASKHELAKVWLETKTINAKNEIIERFKRVGLNVND